MLPAASVAALLLSIPARAQLPQNGVPQSQIGKLPSTEQQYRALKKQEEQNRPAVEAAKKKSESLAAQAEALQRKLIDTAAHVQALESRQAAFQSQILQLSAWEQSLSANLAHDRVNVARTLAILERLQHDMPPAIVLRPGDALGAVHGAMLIGASLPRVYQAAAALARRVEALRRARLALIQKRAEAARNAIQLTRAHDDLNQLLAIKQMQAEAAENEYGGLQRKLDAVADRAASLQSLLARVASLRKVAGIQGVVFVGARPGGPVLARGSLRPPVVGRYVPGGFEGVGGTAAPGITFHTQSGAEVVAPGDAQVLFAGPYHKTGQVLILETAGGYDLVLAGLDRVSVRPGDQLLAGEPLGTMPRKSAEALLYFELRQNGKGVSPVPWLPDETRKRS